MTVVKKLEQIALDVKGEFSNAVYEKGTFNKVNEKLHSMTQWLRLFLESYNSFDIEKLKELTLNKRTIELINFISICNGIIDVSDGLFRVANDYFESVPIRTEQKSFLRTRELNKEHDSFFKMCKYNDYEYFKHIRAVFGQHPSNLEFADKKRGFSSWTFDNSNHLWKFDSDLYTNIYHDHNMDGWGIKFHIYYDEIADFVDGQIEYISTLEDFVIEWIEVKRVDKCSKIRKWRPHLSATQKTKLLQEEIKKRYNFKEYYDKVDELNKLQMLMFESYRINETNDGELDSVINNLIGELYTYVSRYISIKGWKQMISFDNQYLALKEAVEDSYERNGYHYLLEAADDLQKKLELSDYKGFLDEYTEYLSMINASIDELYQIVKNCEQNELTLFNQFVDIISDGIGNSYYQEKIEMFFLGHNQYLDMYLVVVDEVCRKLGIEHIGDLSEFSFCLYLLSSQGKKAIV